MKTIKLWMPMIGLLSAVLFYACDKDSINTLTDEVDLVSQIEAATDTEDISTEDLPNTVQSQLEENYSESFVSRAILARNLGYQVALRRGDGSRVGEDVRAFFNLEGEELFRTDKRRKHRRRKARRDCVKDCFTIQFPFALVMPDDTVINITQREDWQFVRSWYEANPDADQRPSFVFPLEIVYHNTDSVVTIYNEEELAEARSICHDRWDRDQCIEFLFPITLLMPDGETEIQLSAREDWETVERWYEANPDYRERPDLVYPVNILFEGDSISLNSEEELDRAIEACREDWPEIQPCLQLVFPVGLTLPDGTELRLESREDWSQVRRWYEANPDVSERPEFIYPIQVQFADQDAPVTINNEEELERARDSCDN